MKGASLILIGCLVISLAPNDVQAFDNDELEIFDLVEEVNQNFYQFLELEQTASTGEIKKAYRRLSLILHPDKNDAEDAEVKFRWLASIYDTLRDAKKREIYDRVLVEGLPNWKSPVFYYRRMRKIGLLEGLAYLTLIASFIQYAMHWAAYYERKFTLEGNLGEQMNRRSTQKKLKKANKTGEFDQDKILNEHMENLGVVRPSLYDLLPFQIMRFTKATVVALPTLPGVIYAAFKAHREAQEAIRQQEKEEEEEIERREQEKKDRKEKLRQRKLAKPRYEEREGATAATTSGSVAGAAESNEAKEKVPRNARKLWTDDQLAKLCRMMKKYPGGTQDRWDKIAEVMERYPWEITKMAANVKGSMFMAPSQTAGNKVPGLETAEAQEDNTEDSTENSEEDDETDDSSNDDDDDEEEELGYTMASKNDYVPVEVKTKSKTRKAAPPTEEGDAVGSGETVANNNSTSGSANEQQSWTQGQQKSLEQAIKQFPKGTPERWERIAGKVHEKSSEDCIQRFKYLAQMVKAKKGEN